MGEIKMKLKHLLMIVSIFFITIILLSVTNLKCDKLPLLVANQKHLKTIFAITPTYARPVQKAELTRYIYKATVQNILHLNRTILQRSRLAHTIMLVSNIHWIIIEDATETSALVRNVLKRTGLDGRSTQLHAKTPIDFKLKDNDPNWSKPRGVEQRNTGLAWCRHHFQINVGVERNSLVYFMDDDNTYSMELFAEMSQIPAGKVGVWPVGLVGGLMVEKPVLNSDGTVLGFNSVWRPERPFPIDMAGFALSGDLLVNYPAASFSYDVQRGYQESEILRHLTVVRDMVPLANLCTDVLVWHTRTETPKLDAETKLRKEGHRTDEGMEV